MAIAFLVCYLQEVAILALIQECLSKFPSPAFRKLWRFSASLQRKPIIETAAVAFENFMKVMTNKQPRIHHRLDEQSQQLIVANHKKIQSIIETIILCGQQNISPHGYRDSSLEVENNPCAPHGNSWALLEF